MLYDYKCSCGNKFEAFRAIKNRNTAICPKCGEEAKKVLTLGQSIQLFKPYMDEHISDSGEPVFIESKRQKKQLLKQNGLIEIG